MGKENYYNFALICLSATLFCFIPKAISAEFIIKTPFNTPDKDKIYITGDFNGCNWKPDCKELEAIGKNTFIFNTDEMNVKFKITRGLWANEAATPEGLRYSNFICDQKQCLVDIVNWKDMGALSLKGEFWRKNFFYSPELNNSRSLIVRMPQNYKENTTKKYPVIYMHDGQNVFDPRTSSYGVDWAVDDVLSRLEKISSDYEAIVVGVYHKNRAQEYNDEARGEDYSHFLAKTLKPYIDKKFRTLKRKESNFLMGSSYGGAITLTTLFRYPDIFSKGAALALNGDFFNGMFYRFFKMNPIAKKMRTSLYIDHGLIGGDRNYSGATKKLFHYLSSRMEQSFLTYYIFPYSGHRESDWARRVEIPLKFLLQSSN